MATAKKHAERSKRSYHDYKPFGMFERNAFSIQMIKETRKEKESIISRLFKRTTDKGAKA